MKNKDLEESIDKISKFFDIEKNEVRILKSNMSYDEYMDEECIPLCNAMNAVKGIITTSSCSGHGTKELDVYFKATSFKGLFFITRCVDRRYFGHHWNYTVSVGDMIIDGILPTSFNISSKVVGEEAYKESIDLADNMNWHLNHPNFMKGFDLSPDDFEWEYFK